MRNMLSPEAQRLLALLGPEPVEIKPETGANNRAVVELTKYRLAQIHFGSHLMYLCATREGLRISGQFQYLN